MCECRDQPSCKLGNELTDGFNVTLAPLLLFSLK